MEEKHLKITEFVLLRCLWKKEEETQSQRGASEDAPLPPPQWGAAEPQAGRGQPREGKVGTAGGPSTGDGRRAEHRAPRREREAPPKSRLLESACETGDKSQNGALPVGGRAVALPQTRRSHPGLRARCGERRNHKERLGARVQETGPESACEGTRGAAGEVSQRLPQEESGLHPRRRKMLCRGQASGLASSPGWNLAPPGLL